MAVGARGQQLSARTLDARSLLLLGMKRCADCGHGVPFSGWPRNRARRGGLGPVCSHCDSRRSVRRQRQQPAKYAARHQRWREANPEKAAANSRKAASARRARLRDAFVEHIDPFVVYDRDDGRCGVCGRDVPRDRFDIDHIEPLACGGKHAYINVRLAHVACNRSRGRQVASARA